MTKESEDHQTAHSLQTWFSQSLEDSFVQSTDDMSQISKTINHLGSCFYEKANYDLALELFGKCLEMHKDQDPDSLRNSAQVHTY